MAEYGCHTRTRGTLSIRIRSEGSFFLFSFIPVDLSNRERQDGWISGFFLGADTIVAFLFFLVLGNGPVSCITVYEKSRRSRDYGLSGIGGRQVCGDRENVIGCLYIFLCLARKHRMGKGVE
jgi:hypothetical protein